MARTDGRRVEDDSLCWPYGLSLAGDVLAVADSGNNRVMICGPSSERRCRCASRACAGSGVPALRLRLAEGLGLTGFVGNDSRRVFIEAQGAPPSIEAFVSALHEAPPMSRVASVVLSRPIVVPEQGFRIAASVSDDGVTSIPPDTAVCADCLAEMRDPNDRRHGYPFIACTNCGPRYTIVTGLPYDRPFTTMADFPLCADCQAEYDDPGSRRFHAQPTACPECGPRSTPRRSPTSWPHCNDGLIVAIKGVGGYHLACDARQARCGRSPAGTQARGDPSRSP